MQTVKESLASSLLTRRISAHASLATKSFTAGSQGLVWLIEFATAKDDAHGLKDRSKLLAVCPFLLQNNSSEEHGRIFAKLMACTAAAVMALPVIDE